MECKSFHKFRTLVKTQFRHASFQLPELLLIIGLKDERYDEALRHSAHVHFIGKRVFRFGFEGIKDMTSDDHSARLTLRFKVLRLG